MEYQFQLGLIKTNDPIGRILRIMKYKPSIKPTVYLVYLATVLVAVLSVPVSQPIRWQDSKPVSNPTGKQASYAIGLHSLEIRMD